MSKQKCLKGHITFGVQMTVAFKQSLMEMMLMNQNQRELGAAAKTNKMKGKALNQPSG